MSEGDAPAFLLGGGSVGALMRAHDWARSPLGRPESWPQPLQTLVGVMLGAGQPMFLAWGPGHVLLYNDPYAAILGGKHPAALGGNFLDVWNEVRAELLPMVRHVFAGEPVHMADIALTLERHGRPEEAHFAFSYTPVQDETGAVVGLFCACMETTAQVMAERQRSIESERLRAMFEQAPGAVAILRGPEHVFEMANPAYVRLVGGRPLIGRTVRDAFPELGSAAFFGLLDEVYRSNRAYVGIAVPIRLHSADGGFEEERSLDFVYQPLTDGQGHVDGIFVQVTDVTERLKAETRLSLSEARNRQILDSATDYAIIATDLSGSVTRWNRGAERIFGWTETEMLGRPADMLFAPGEPAAVAAVPAGIEDHAGPDEHRTIRKSGEPFWASSEINPLRNEVGEVTGFVQVVRDMTERRAAADMLRRSEDRFRILAEASPGCVWTADPDGTLTYSSPRWQDYAGTDAGEGWTECVNPADRDRTHETWARSRQTGQLFEAECRLRSREGTYRWWLVRALPVRDESGIVALWAGVCADIDDIVAAREALARSHEELETQVAQRTADRNRMWKLSTDIMLVARLDGTTTAVNPAWSVLLGWTEHELLGLSFMSLVHPDDAAATVNAVGRLESGETVLRFENRYRHKDGSYRWLSWTAVPEAGLIHAVGRDISADKEQAEVLTQTEEALRQAQKMEAVGQLTGGLAHDFNNLLTGISGSLELIQARVAQGRASEIDRFVSAAQGAARRAAALTHRLLAFSRRQTLDPKPTELLALIHGMEELVARTVGPEISVEVAADSERRITRVDPGQLENALLNLCINARDAMPHGGRLVIETGKVTVAAAAARERQVSPGQYVTLSVSDNGTGMERDVIARAFDPFFTTKPIGLGTGLGLSMVYGFVRQSGGLVRIYSELGQGTTVCLYLPRFAGGAETDGAPDPNEDGSLDKGSGETVLVVDDEPTVRMLVVEVLESLGYAAIEAADGTAALDILRSDERIDLIVTDVGLPGGMNGRQVADAALALRPGLKILFITGYAEQAALSFGHLQPGMHVLIKPFAVETLARRISDLIGAPRTAATQAS